MNALAVQAFTLQDLKEIEIELGVHNESDHHFDENIWSEVVNILRDYKTARNYLWIANSESERILAVAEFCLFFESKLRSLGLPEPGITRMSEAFHNAISVGLHIHDGARSLTNTSETAKSTFLASENLFALLMKTHRIIFLALKGVITKPDRLYASREVVDTKSLFVSGGRMNLSRQYIRSKITPLLSTLKPQVQRNPIATGCPFLKVKNGMHAYMACIDSLATTFDVEE